MRILYIVPYAPSLIRVRPYQLIRALAARGHEVELATLWSTEEERESLQRMARESANLRVHAVRLPTWRPLWNCLRTLPSRVPLQAAFSFDPGLLQRIDEVLRDRLFDVVHVEHLRGSLFGLGVRSLLAENGASGRPHGAPVPVVWDCVDCISHLFHQASQQSRSLKGRWMTRLELTRTRHYEGWLTTQFDHTLATSSSDRDALQQLTLGLPATAASLSSAGSQDCGISVLPNGVDLDYFHPPTTVRDNATLVFSGKMSYHANVTAASYLIREIMPRVWQKRPDVKVIIAGKNPPRSLRSMAASTGPQSGNDRNSSLAAGPAVRVTGTIPDLRPYLHRATIALAPLPYGAGIQNKVLEAMACATPVIASPKAVAALTVHAGRDLLVAADAENFAHQVVSLLSDEPRREAIGRAGRIFVETHHDWRRIGGLLEATYRQAIEAVRENESQNSYGPRAATEYAAK